MADRLAQRSADAGDFCNKGARFGAHAVTETIYAPYCGKIIGVSWFNGGS
jgi:hypothetical protein